jgi:hypothetical protein
MSTVPYAYEPGLIARLLGVVLEAVGAYGVRLLRMYEEPRTAPAAAIYQLSLSRVQGATAAPPYGTEIACVNGLDSRYGTAKPR